MTWEMSKEAHQTTYNSLTRPKRTSIYTTSVLFHQNAQQSSSHYSQFLCWIRRKSRKNPKFTSFHPSFLPYSSYSFSLFHYFPFIVYSFYFFFHFSQNCIHIDIYMLRVFVVKEKCWLSIGKWYSIKIKERNNDWIKCNKSALN